MRAASIFVAALTLAPAAQAADKPKDQAHQYWDWCIGAGDPSHLRTDDFPIGGCTAVIESRQPPEADLAEAYFNRANAFARSGELDKAIADYSDAIKRKPNYVLAYIYRAEVSDQKKAGSGVDDFLKAFALDPQNALVWSSQDYIVRKEWEHALRNYGRALALHTNDALVLKSRGDVYNEKGDHALAIADYTQALKLDAKFAVVYLDRGLAYHRQGNHERSESDYAKGLELLPNDADALDGLSRELVELGRFEQAMTVCDKLLVAAPDRVLGWQRRGDLHFRLSKWREAVAEYDEALRQYGGVLPPSLFARGVAKLHLGDAEGGKRDLATAERADPKIAATMATRGIHP